MLLKQVFPLISTRFGRLFKRNSKGRSVEKLEEQIIYHILRLGKNIKTRSRCNFQKAHGLYDPVIHTNDHV